LVTARGVIPRGLLDFTYPMTSVEEVKEWLELLDDTNGVAIDDGGLRIVELDQNEKETGKFIEIGGIPG
jgi:hypothetical protein